MPNEAHLSILLQGVQVWNRWRAENPTIRPDLSDFDFARVPRVDSYDSDDNAYPAQLWKADLANSNLLRARLSAQHLQEANFCESDLTEALLNDAVLKFTNLRNATLRRANLKGARLIGANFRGADLSGASVFGVSVWGSDFENAVQNDLLITPPLTAPITVDNVEVSQLIYTFLENPRIRVTVEELGHKLVLILGSFAPAPKEILDTIRDELRARNYVPVLFDFEKPVNRNRTEVIGLLARLSRLIIADLSQPRSVLVELQSIIPDVRTVPVQALIKEGEILPGMTDAWKDYNTFLPIQTYANRSDLIRLLPTLLDRAETFGRK